VADNQPSWTVDELKMYFFKVWTVDDTCFTMRVVAPDLGTAHTLVARYPGIVRFQPTASEEALPLKKLQLF
jgi:hypothetical protein